MNHVPPSEPAAPARSDLAARADELLGVALRQAGDGGGAAALEALAMAMAGLIRGHAPERSHAETLRRAQYLVGHHYVASQPGPDDI